MDRKKVTPCYRYGNFPLGSEFRLGVGSCYLGTFARTRPLGGVKENPRSGLLEGDKVSLSKTSADFVASPGRADQFTFAPCTPHPCTPPLHLAGELPAREDG